MGKRSNFERVPRDYYPTPIEAFLPLIPHLKHGSRFIEPCCGDGRLVQYLLMSNLGLSCQMMADIEPIGGAWHCDARDHIWLIDFDLFITNPPWSRDVLHSVIENLSDQKPTWLLFDADWMHTKQSAEYMWRCEKIVSVGRMKWIEGSKMTGKDNCAWYLFDGRHKGPTMFCGR